MNWCDVNIYTTVVQCIAGSSLGPLRNKSIYLRSIAQIMTHRFLLTGPMASVFFSTSKRRVRLHCGKEVAMVHFMPDALDRQKTREDDSLTDENWPLG